MEPVSRPTICASTSALALPADLNAISASDVRRRIREGAAWQRLVPDPIMPMLREVREIYRPPA